MRTQRLRRHLRPIAFAILGVPVLALVIVLAGIVFALVAAHGASPPTAWFVSQ